jgi:hypothetical protein
MLFRSFLRFFKRRRTQPITRQPVRRTGRLQLEHLEDRTLLSVAPVITSVTPSDGSSTTSAHPSLVVTFNEDVVSTSPSATNSVTNPNNYKLFDSSGTSFTVNSVNYSNGGGSGPFTATIIYNGGGNLVVNNYTLFINAANIVGTAANGSIPMSQPGKVVVANSGANNISTISMPGNGTLGALSDYPLPPSGSTQSSPKAVVLADLNGDGVPDLVVLDGGTNALDIYAGQSGGGYSLSPSTTITLDTSSGASALAVGNFTNTKWSNGAGKLSIAVANTSLGSVSTFLNTGVNVGDLLFATGVDSTVGSSPNGIAVADFNGDGNLDLAVSNGAAGTDVDADTTADSDYFVSILPGTASGAFGTATNIVVGDNATGTEFTPSGGFTAPTGIAQGNISGGQLPDIVISGALGIDVLANTTKNNTLSFKQTIVNGPGGTAVATTSVAVGLIRNASGGTPLLDVAATTGTTTGQVIVWVNDNTGTLSPLTAIAANGTPVSISLAKLTAGGSSASGLNDIVVANNIAAGQITVLRNLSTVGSISSATADGTKIVYTATNTLQINDWVDVTGVKGLTGANGLFQVTASDGATFTVASSAAAGTSTASTGNFSGLYFANGAGTIPASNGAANTVGQPVTLTTRNHGLVNGQQVTVNNITGQTVPNGTYFVHVVDANTFQLVGTSATSTASATGGTWSVVPTSVDSSPAGLAIGDTNGDGISDIVTGNSAGKDVSVLVGVGDTTFQVATNLSVSTATQPDAVAVGDFNGDGLPDIAVADFGTSQLSIFLAQSAGGYAKPLVYSTISGTGPNQTGQNPISIAVGDFFGTGRLSIAVASQRNNNVTIFQNTGNSGQSMFSLSGTAATGQTPTQILAGKFTTDGKVSLIVSHNGQGRRSNPGITFLRGNGDGTFQAGVEVGSGTNAIAIGIGDFNNDGNLDFVALNNNNNPSVVLFTGNGAGSFSSAGSFAVNLPSPVGLAVADFNVDGLPDVAVISNSTSSTNNIAVLLNSAGSGFGQPVFTSIAAGLQLQSIQTAHVYDSPYPDLILTTVPLAISGASNAGPIVITINGTNTGLTNGEVVTITGVQGNTAANGTWTIASVSTAKGQTTFSLTGSTGNGKYTSGGVLSLAAVAGFDNVFTMQGVGDGTFINPKPYDAGGSSAPTPSYATVVADPFLRVTTFTTGGTTLKPNMVVNGNFAVQDLNGEQGNLDGWTTVNLMDNPGSNGGFVPEQGTTSPLSGTTVPAPANSKFEAMLDEENQQPVPPQIGKTPPANPNTADTYQGTHALYQDISIPTGASTATVTFTLYIDNSHDGATGYTDTTLTPTLDFRTSAANQQVRVDLVNPNAAAFTTTADDQTHSINGVLQNLFVTAPGQSATQTVTKTVDVSNFAGQTVRLRFATTNNQGLLIVGVGNVKLQALFSDSTGPGLSGLQMQNPSELATASLVDPTTSPTIIGKLSDNGSVNNVSYIEFDIPATSTTPALVKKITTWDANGNFSFPVPVANLVPGLNTITLKAVDKANNVTTATITFNLQGPSDVNWAQQGPGPVNVTTQGVNYSTISGNITSVATDPRDPAGNTMYVGTDNGGVWSTTNGGASWQALTDNVHDSSGNPVAESIGAVGLGYTTDPLTPVTYLYGATGVAENATTAHAGQGVLVSSDKGVNWTLTGARTASGTVTSVTSSGTAIVINTVTTGLQNGDQVTISNVGGTTNANGMFTITNVTATSFQLVGPTFNAAYTTGGTWVLNNLVGAYVSAVAVSPVDYKTAYVAVAFWSDKTKQPGIFRTTDGGQTWVNVLNPVNMHVGNNTLAAGTTLASVTSLVIDPFNPDRILIGMGNMLPGSSASTAGVWLSINDGNSWTAEVGGDNANIPNNTLPTGSSLGRVTVAIGSGSVSYEKYVYVLIANPPGTQTAGSYNDGTFQALYKTKDNMLNFTKVQLKQNIGSQNAQNFSTINVFGNEGSDVGALIVDPTNPNVAYIGGSNNFSQNQLNHYFIRVDTGDMRDTTYIDPTTSKLSNDGDDIQKAFTAENPPPVKSTKTVARTANDYYDNATNATAYTGEGVYWYDLSTGAPSGANGKSDTLPTGIHALTFDNQGRLVVGTEEGIFRLIPLGFGYDYTSGGSGMMAQGVGAPGDPNLKQFSTIGARLISINGNLQIADVTAAAIDPSSPTTLYSAADYGGTAVTTAGPTGWVSSGLTGPINGTTGASAGIPNAANLLVSGADPTAPAGTPSTLYRVWQYAATQSYLPEDSVDGGQTFNPVAAAGISVNDQAGLNPAFAINPNKIVVNGVPEDQLLFGTQKVYLTSTSSNVWDAISGNLTTGYISALAFAPNHGSYYYAGSTLGEVFVLTPTNGGFTSVSTGLPGNPGTSTAPTVNGIAVDPSDPHTFFVMLSGNATGFSHIWETTNGGSSWSAVNALTGGGSLPDVAAYTMIIDPTPAPGAAQGRYYLGTGVGVYVSYDKGQDWSPLGKGMPNAPVVDLQFDPNQQFLVAAVQGRGVYTLSTRLSGPQVIATTPTTPQSQPLTQITVTFNESVDPRTFNVGQDALARYTIASGLTGTSQFFTNQVDGLYVQLLRRSAGNDNISWATSLYQSSGYQAVVAALASSSEYFSNPSLGNNSNATWLNQVYQDLLFRTSAGDSTAASYLSQLTGGTITRLQVAQNIVATSEYQADLIASLFNLYLGMNKPVPADTTDTAISGWLNQFSLGGNVQQLIAVLVGSTNFYAASGGFYNAGAGSSPSAVAVADLTGNKDGHGTPINDLIVVDGGTNNVEIFQGLGNGVYPTKPTLTLALPSGAGASAVVTGDFNNDGLPDIAVLDSTTNQISVFLDTSTGGVLAMGSRSDYSLGSNSSSPVGLVAGDFNNAVNGSSQPILDLATVSSKAVSSKFNLTILTGSSSGVFSSTPVTVTTGFTVAPTALAFGDFNGDGKQDFVVTANSGGATPTGGVRLLQANWTSPATLTYAASSLSTAPSTAVAVGNIDHNTTTDLAVGTAAGNVLVFQNQGTTTNPFGATPSPLSVSAGGTPVALALTDLNADGLADIVVLNGGSSGNLTTLFNTTPKASGLDSISFNSPVTYPVAGSGFLGLALGDTNQDSVLDAVVAASGANAVSIVPGSNYGFFQVPTDLHWLNAAYERMLGTPYDSNAVNNLIPQLGLAEQSSLSFGNDQAAPLSIVDTNPGTDTIYQLTFGPLGVDSTYTLTLGPNTLGLQIRDFVDVNGTYKSTGNAMNQNGNTANGEFPADRFTGEFAVNNSDDGKFVSGLYHNLLGTDPNGRAADTNGFVLFLGMTDNGQVQALNQVVPFFTTSAEYRGDLVAGYFQTYLRRTAGTNEISLFVNLMSGGMTEEGVIISLVTSGEYFNNPSLGNGSNATWLNQMYLDLLGRSTAGDAGATTFLNALNAHTLSLTQVAGFIINSGEYQGRLIYSTFQKLLGRAPHDFPDPAVSEYAFWTSFLQTRQTGGNLPTPDEQFINAILTSKEYFERAGDSIIAWITNIYAKLLGRAPGSSELSMFNNLVLNAGSFASARSVVVSLILSSGEYQARVITTDFQTYLGRGASAGEIGIFAPELAAPGGDALVISQILSSPEFLALTGGGSSNSTWVQKVYNLVLSRTAVGDNGATSFTNYLNSLPSSQTQQGRQAVAQVILGSAEYYRDLAAQIYNKYLARSKAVPASTSDSELTNWVTFFQNGGTPEQMIAVLLTSGEYFDDQHTFP